MKFPINTISISGTEAKGWLSPEKPEGFCPCMEDCPLEPYYSNCRKTWQQAYDLAKKNAKPFEDKKYAIALLALMHRIKVYDWEIEKGQDSDYLVEQMDCDTKWQYRHKEIAGMAPSEWVDCVKIPLHQNGELEYREVLIIPNKKNMKSKIAQKIIDQTPESVKQNVNEIAKKMVESSLTNMATDTNDPMRKEREQMVEELKEITDGKPIVISESSSSPKQETEKEMIEYWAGRLIGYDQAWDVAKEIVDEINEWKTTVNSTTLLNESYKNEIAELRSKLSPSKETGWIRMSERMPDTEVILLTSSKIQIIGDWYKGEWRTHLSHWENGVLKSAFKEKDIVAWHPLPIANNMRHHSSLLQEYHSSPTHLTDAEIEAEGQVELFSELLLSNQQLGSIATLSKFTIQRKK